MKKGTVIAATSDIHGDTSGILDVVRANNVDVLVIAGDIQPASIYVQPDEWFRRAFFPLVAKLPCKVVSIPGNHDFWLASHLQTLGQIAPPNFTCLVDEMVTVNGINFWGSPWVPYINGNWCFEAEEGGDVMTDFLKRKFSTIPSTTDVLITHSPMRLGDSDYSLQYDVQKKRPFGSASLRDVLKDRERLPHLMFCGHIHSGSHKCEIFGNGKCPYRTYCYNVSRVDERYTIAYPIRVVEVRENSIVAYPYNQTQE